jgi:hypothetical protein
MDNDQRIAEGKRFAETIWWKLAKRIVQIAGELYAWDNDTWEEMQDMFLRPGDYSVEPC